MRNSRAPKILAHRGHWKGEFGLQDFEPNSLNALLRAAENGFGIETDLRDHCGDIVVSHDPVKDFALNFREFEELDVQGLVALNVKSDGLVPLLTSSPVSSSFEYFFFDMSFPELRKYSENQLPFASRISEVENFIHDRSQYIWLDSFVEDWFITEDSIALQESERKVIVVSPELHNRPYMQAWKWVANAMGTNANLFICTDFPGQFLEYVENYS